MGQIFFNATVPGGFFFFSKRRCTRGRWRHAADAKATSRVRYVYLYARLNAHIIRRTRSCAARLNWFLDDGLSRPWDNRQVEKICMGSITLMTACQTFDELFHPVMLLRWYI